MTFGIVDAGSWNWNAGNSGLWYWNGNNYFPAYDGVTPQVVTYSYKVNISNTNNITSF